MKDWLLDFSIDSWKDIFLVIVPKIIALFLIVFFLIITPILMFIWSSEPERFDIMSTVSLNQEETAISGVYTVSSSIKLTDILLNKTGGYLSNDITPPSIFLDNIPAWELGVVEVQRAFLKVLRDDLSRSQSQSSENENVVNANTSYNNDHAKWMLPNSEDKYAEANVSLEKYLKELRDPRSNAKFYPRADNLVDLLQSFSKRLGSTSQSLSESTNAHRESQVKTTTSWWLIDDVFYQSRGQTYAMLHILKAVKVDFKDVLEGKNAMESLNQIIVELEDTQQVLYSPMVLNGNGFGVLPNHSLVMANYISRANAAMIDIISLLNKG